MRLVDADALNAKIGNRHMFSGERVGDFIDNSPTVNAIPVKWIKQVRNDSRLTIDDIETIDLILTWWRRNRRQ